MKLQLHLFIFFLLTCLKVYAQPANDEPCNATFLGRLDENNRSIVATGLSNIGATNEVIFGDDSGLVLEIGGRFPSCKGSDSWRNTVWFYFDYEYPFNKIFSYEMRVNSGSLHTTLFLSQSICPLFGSTVPIVFAASDRGCNVPANDSEGFSLGCFDFSAWPNSRAGRIYIVVASDTDTEEGEFELEISLPEPTFCNECQDQNETAVDDTFEIDNLSKEDENAGSSNGSITVDGVTGGKQPLSYSIDGISFQNETTFQNLAAGTYTVTVQDASGCQTTQEITLDQRLPSPPEVNPPQVVCEGDPQTVSAIGSNILWYSDAALSNQVGMGKEFTFNAGEYIILYATQTINGFETTATAVNISFIDLPEVSIQTEGDECTAIFIAVLNPTNALATYQWLRNGVEIEGETNNTLNSIGSGSYQVRVMIDSCIILSEEESITGDIPAKPTVNEPPVYCEGDVIQPLMAESNGEIRWYANETLTQEVGMGETFQPIGLNITTTFWVQASNNNCLSNTASITVTISPVPSASISPQNTLCIGEPLEAITDNLEGVTYQWILNEQAIQGATEQIFIPQESGTYRVQISRSSCSTTSDSLRINDLPIANAGQDQTICLGDPIMLGNDTTNITNTFEWFGENGNLLSNESTFEIMPTDTTFYVLQVTDANACFSVDTVNIQVDNTPIEAGFSVPYTAGYAPLEISFTDESGLADTVFWDFDDGNTSTKRNPTYIFEKVGEYEVLQQVSVNEICFRDTTILIQVIEPLNIPNGISPNGDGSNDRWIIENIDLFPEHTIRVFNQWGNLVFEASNYQNDWQGDNLPDATYFYVITLGSNVPDAKGYLVILR